MREKVCVVVKEKESVRRNDCLTSDPATEIQEKHTLRAPLTGNYKEGHPESKQDRPSLFQTPSGSHQVTDCPTEEGRRGAGQSAGNLMLQENAKSLSLPNPRCCLFHLAGYLYS